MTDTFGKITDRDTVARVCEEARAAGKVTGFTSGTFDILHAGHVHYLTEAKKLCDLLIVGVNSDASVRKYKSPKRPIHAEDQRAAVLAALEAVDHVFIFDESNTNRSIEILKPDLYIKGGDRKKEQLTSAPIVEGYGGRVVIIPPLPGVSTTSSITRIVEKYAGEVPLHVDINPYDPAPAVFIDRDGTIIEQIDYLHDPDRVKVIPGAFDALRRMRKAGARIVIVTNQPGIGTGYFSKDDFFLVNKRLLSEATDAGVLFDRIFYCPHSKGDECECRKPGTGMIVRAENELNLDLTRSFVIGDMTSDIELARRAGCRSILVQTGRAGRDGLYDFEPDYVAKDLNEAAGIVEESLSADTVRKGKEQYVQRYES